MKTTISFCFLLALFTAKAQCPAILGVTQTDTGSGSYHLDVVFDNPDALELTYTWFYYPASGTGGMGGYAYFPDPGFYEVWVSAYFDDPSTQQPDDCQVSYLYQAEVVCDAIELDYPITLEDTLNQQFLVTSQFTGGTPPYSYSWQVDLPYTDLGDGTISVPFTDAGYMNGDLVVIDANGCFTWPHFFGGTNPEAECEFQHAITQNGNLVHVTMNAFLGTSELLYPMYEVDFGDGETVFVFDQNMVSHEYATPGEYEVCIYASNEGNYCEHYICETVQVGVSTSTLELAKDSDIMVYPNPSHGDITISAEPNTHVVIYNIFGKEIMNTFMLSNSFQLHQLAKGSYLVKLENGQKSEVKHLIIN